jgi:hypothetical protein
MKTPEEMAAFLTFRGWEYGQTRQHGWAWKHRNIGSGVCFTLAAAFEIETRERVSERGRVYDNA